MMKTISEIRLRNLDILVEKLGSQEKVAELGGTSPVYLSQLRNKSPDSKTGKPRDVGTPLARKLEAGCRKELDWMEVGWMDNNHDEGPVGAPAALSLTAEEPNAPYRLGARAQWPFHDVQPDLYRKLTDYCQGQVEGFVKSLLQNAANLRAGADTTPQTAAR